MSNDATGNNNNHTMNSSEEQEMLYNNPQKGKYYVVEINVDNKQKVVIGSCLVTYEWSDWRCLDYYWLQSVYVDVEHRRKGVFTKLFKHVENICKENNVL
ncbi:hypothetical protein ABK040_011274 [Willaertia magna]